ncbi:MAG: hypothetical protein J5931_10815 [Prevotella sp.]|nr:hypothetical protein [Prevotella sp.]
MIRFEYDNIEADKLILEFKCKECHSLTKTELLNVPELDFNTYKDIRCSYKHKCQCGACYPIEITNGLYDSFGLIDGIDGNEEDVFVHEVPDFPYDKNTILLDTIHAYSRIESIVNGIKGLSKEDKNYVYCLMFSNLISILDSFIKIYTEPIVLGNDDFIEKFSVSFRMPKGNREEKIEKIKDFYKRKSFQSISNQKKLFKDVFNFDIEIDERIEKYVAIRDVIIHRNAIDPDGFMFKIKKSQLLQALDVIKIYIRHIHSALFDYETDIYADMIINR